MSRVKCKNCGAECCSCWGCNPATYANGLCPKCQKDAQSNTEQLQGLQQPVRFSMSDRREAEVLHAERIQ